VAGNIKYKSDDKNYKLAEFWQHPEVTLQKGTGDCEDGALLLISLMRCAGIPAYRCKLCAGWVKTRTGRGGHAYVIYLANDDNWYTLDWCYWPGDSVKNFRQESHEKNKKYQQIWWTVNDEFSWAQKSVELK
jgi:predicted transglutaminase-like cysteine proteinase